MERIIYAGTYTSKESEGIYSFTFKDGELLEPKLFAKIRNPKYITIHDGSIAAVADLEQDSGVAILNEKGDIIQKLSFEERTSCYITQCEDRIFTANYHTGTVSLLKIDEDGVLKLEKSVQIQDGAGCHQVLVWKDFVLVPCLFLDRVVIFDADLNRKGSLKFNAGTGPRHGVFSEDGSYLYLVSELSNELYVIHTGDWNVENVISILPNGETHARDTAAIRLSEDEKYLYISTRKKDLISVVELTDHKPELIQCVWCGGKHPRDFILIDHYLLCANRASNEVVCFEVDPDGTLGKITSRIKVPEAVSLCFE